ncbi:terminase small subunit [Tissierella praeacuta]|uniref:terminase small subunit n=1 Tax=Tissierella praeacuta TaxID=43131 RepID=UPI003DA40E7E
MENVRLTNNQKIFCDEYLIDLNATRAYKVAYKSCKKDETARANSSRLLTNANIKNYIDKKMKEREKRTEITQDFVLQELAKIARAKGSDFGKVTVKTGYRNILNENGEVIGKEPFEYQTVEMFNTDDIPLDKQAAIAGIKMGANGIEVKLNDKVKALELIGRHLGMFTEKLEVKGELNTGLNKLNSILEQLKE